MTDTVQAYAYVAEIVHQRNAAFETIKEVARMLRDLAEETTDEQAAARLNEIAADLTGGEE